MNDEVTHETEESVEQAPDLATVLAETVNNFAEDGSGTIIDPEEQTDAVEVETGTVDTGGAAEVQGEPVQEEPQSAEVAQSEETAKEPAPDFSFSEDTRYMNSLKPRTRERLQALMKDRNKYKDQAADYAQQIEQEYKQAAEFKAQMTTALQQSQMTQEDMEWMLTTNRLLKSGDFGDLQQASQMVDQLKANIDQRMGRTSGAGTDPLADRPDLLEQVQKYQISRAHAEKIATLERQNNAQQQHRQALGQQNQQQAALRQEYNVASQQMVGMEKHWQASDPNFGKKQKALTGYLEGLMQSGLPPRQWPGLLKSEYDRVSALEKEFTAAPAKPTSAQPAPLRPTGSTAVPAATAPKDMNDALTQELARMRTG